MALTGVHMACTIRPMYDAIDRACQAADGLSKLAAAIGQSMQTVSNWRVRGVPIVHCADVERISGGTVTRRDLRPDDWWRIWPELVDDEHPVPAVEARDAA